MSKPISFGFGKSKPPSTANVATAKSGTSSIAISIPSRGSGTLTNKKPRALDTRLHDEDDSDNDDTQQGKLEAVAGFGTNGIILSQPVQEKEEAVIKNPGNSDWRRRGRQQRKGGKNLLPEEVQAAQREQQNGGDVIMIEKDEVSKKSGLEFAQAESEHNNTARPEQPSDSAAPQQPEKPLTEDEIALRALLDPESQKAKSNAIIESRDNDRLMTRDTEQEDFRTDVNSRPDSSTLEDYAAMPVEEFGLAMLRGMGVKRRANGEIISVGSTNDSAASKDIKSKYSSANGTNAAEAKKVRKQEGFLGIGAKPIPSTTTGSSNNIAIELGAWGKADMRKNQRGEGFFTPLMRENKVTGERITEEELQRRIKDAKVAGRKGGASEDDWRDRRDRNLERSSRDRHRDGDRERKLLTNGEGESGTSYKDQMNDFSSRHSSSSRRHRDDDDYDGGGADDRRDNDRHRGSRNDRERHRSRSRSRDRRKDRHHGQRDRYRDDDRHDSSSSKRSSHRDRDRDTKDRDKGREKD